MVRVHSSSDDSRRIHEIQQGREFLSHKRHALTSTTTAVLLQPNGRRTREVFPGAPRTHSCTRTRISSVTRYDYRWASGRHALTVETAAACLAHVFIERARISHFEPPVECRELAASTISRQNAKLLKLLSCTCVVLVLSLSNLPKSDKSV